MELTQTYHNKATFTNQSPTSFGKMLTTFLRKHAQVFQSLTRGGAPYGESIRPNNARSVALTPAGGSPRHQLAQLQRQVNDLSQTVAQLRDQVDGQPSPQRADSTGQVGLNRFRALKTGACS